MIRLILRCKQIYDKFSRDEMTVYAAQASFFTIIAAFPFIMLLMAMIQVIPTISKADLLQLIMNIVPQNIKSLVVGVVETIYTTSPITVLSVTAITAVWSASRGMFGIMRGLNRVFGMQKKRNYVVTRLICAGYTIVFIAICILTLVLLVFGTSIQGFLEIHLPVISEITHYIITFRTVLLLILTICFTCLYTYVPEKKQQFCKQIPGAVFSTIGWIGFSFAFSIYFNHFSNYSVMYGSLTAIVLVMLWLYFCICILFLGAELNYFYSGDWKRSREFTSIRAFHS